MSLVDEIVKFISEIKPMRMADRPGYIDIDLTPQQVAELVKERFKNR